MDINEVALRIAREAWECRQPFALNICNFATRLVAELQKDVEPFGYFHQLLDHEGSPNGIWLGCDDRAVTEQSHIEGETAPEIVALYAHPQPKAATVPEGWKLVPVEPTDAMCEAGWLYRLGKQEAASDDIYRAMLEAAPSIPTQSTAPTEIKDYPSYLAGFEYGREYERGLAAQSEGALVARVKEAWQHYERMGEACQFEGNPMIYASVLEELNDHAQSEGEQK